MNIQKIKINNVSHTQPIKVNNAQSIVFNMKTQEKVVIPTKETQHINPDIGYNALSKVIVEPIPVNYIQPTETKKINSNGIHNIKEYANVEVDVQPNLQDKKVIVKPNDNKYIMPDEDYYGLAVVNVIGVVDTENVEATPTKETQTINRSEKKYIESVTINPIPNEYIIPSGELEITENGNYDVTDKASVNVEIASSGSADLSEYFTETISKGTSTSSGIMGTIKKIPKFVNTGTICDYMFANFKGLELDLSNFDTTECIGMYQMFYNNENITSLDLSNFYTPNLTNTYQMFRGDTSLMYLDMRNFDFTNVSNYNQMFGSSASNGPANDCLIIVKDETAKTWITEKFSRLTNVKTVAEYETQ